MAALPSERAHNLGGSDRAGLGGREDRVVRKEETKRRWCTLMRVVKEK